jgi:hypothetical protein
VNLSNFKRVMDVIRAQPQRWDQSAFESRTLTDCNTAYCFAGWCIVLERADRALKTPSDLVAGMPSFSIIRKACEFLGIQPKEGESHVEMPWLFEAKRTLEDLLDAERGRVDPVTGHHHVSYKVYPVPIMVIKTNGVVAHGEIKTQNEELKTLQNAVGGYTELWPNFINYAGRARMAYVNEDGVALGLPLNSIATRLAGAPVLGNMVVVLGEVE